MDREGGIPRLLFRIHRLRTSYRFTYAFHAREVRFERDAGQGFERLFPETFSFHADRHDPAELYLRLEDLLSNPERLGPGTTRRDAEELVLRLLEALPSYLEGILDRLEEGSAQRRASEDVAVFAQVALRFAQDKGLAEHPRVALSALHLRRLALRALCAVLAASVPDEALERYRRGELEPDAPVDAYDAGFFYALAEDDAERTARAVLGATERAYHRWLEEVCLDEENPAFEIEGSPFDEREVEVLRAVSSSAAGPVRRARELSPFLCRSRNRDCLRLLGRLERWFLRQYDVHHAAVVLHHADRLRRGREEPDRVLSRHSNRSYVLALLIGAIPFLAATFLYERAPLVLDALVSLEVALVVGAALWFLAYRFMWKKDLTFFHASVPRIGAGIIVGYLPVFLIDEVWDLAEQSLFYIVFVVLMLGSTTLLYLYVEVQRRLRDPERAFPRAVGIFLLGLIEAAALGLVVTSLLGPLMAVRNWGPEGAVTSLETLRTVLPPFAGELPRVLGVEPFPAFPTAVLLMTFLSFFIGTFLQLLWEDLPITEPL